MISRQTVQDMRKMDAEGVPRKDIAKRIGCCIHTVIKYCGVKCSQRAKMAVERKASIIASLAEGKAIKVVAFEHDTSYAAVWRIAAEQANVMDMPSFTGKYRKVTHEARKNHQQDYR